MGLRLSSVSLGLAIVGGVVFACGGSGDGSFFGPPGGTGEDASDGSSGGIPPEGFGSDATPGEPQLQPLTIDPPTATLTVNSRGTILTQNFVAKSAGQVVNAQWTLDKYDAGSINATGTFSSAGIVAGKAKITAHYKTVTGTAEINVVVQLKENLTPAPTTPGNKTALEGTPTADPGGANATKIVYPLNGTVMPRGLTSPVLQLTPGTVAPQDAKISLKCSKFSWEGYGKVPAPGTPQVQIPQDVWDAFTQSCGGEEADISVVKASGGTAYGPYTQKMIIAAATLKGAVFYQSYQDGFVGLWSVKPGVKTPATHIFTKCVVCHSVSANGETLTAGMDPVGAESGAYRAKTDGTITQVAATPTTLGPGDSRGLGFAFITPDGKYVLRGQNDFWGGINTKAFKVNPNGTATSQMAEASVNGLAAVPAYLPSFSPDAKKLVFVNGDSATLATARKSITVMDAQIDPTAGPNGTLSFTNPTIALDTGKVGGSGLITKFPAFLPDSKQIVLQEGTNGPDNCNNYGGMLPHYGCNTGKLFLLRDNEHIELAKMNTGTVAADLDRNYEPFTLPVAAGGYFWVVFTSRREYGNTYVGDAVRKQLWVAAVSPTSATGVDPSYPAFYLPNQSNSANERGFWALEPCRAEGAGCSTGDECCDGFCRPSDETNPASSRVCKRPIVGQCSQVAEKCTTSADCCGAPPVVCIGGFCTDPPPR